MLEAATRHTGLTPNKARALLGRFLFSGDEAEKPLDGLSGGERKRLALAILVQSGANVLVLDEPTNHLDLESREALEDALRAFPGALLLVTHDRALLDAVGSRTVAIENHGLRSYEGGWAEYSRVREERKARGEPPGGAPAPAPAKRAANGGGARAPAAGPAPTPQPARTHASPARKGPSKNRVREQQRLEAAVERAEAELATVEEELAAPERWATKYETAKSTARHTAARRAVEDAYAALEAFEAAAPA